MLSISLQVIDKNKYTNFKMLDAGAAVAKAQLGVGFWKVLLE